MLKSAVSLLENKPNIVPVRILVFIFIFNICSNNKNQINRLLNNKKKLLKIRL